MAGDTVIIPNGDCTWSAGVSINGIHLQGQSLNNVIIRGAGVSLTKHATTNTRMSNLRFLGNAQFSVDGSSSAKPFIIDHNYFETTGGTLGHVPPMAECFTTMSSRR